MRRWIALFTALTLCLLPLCGHAETVFEETATHEREKNAPLRLLDELYDDQDTLVFSPLSLSIALSMAADGAEGDTKSQLDAFLADSCPDWYVLEDLSFSYVYQANAAFLRPGFELLPEYEDALLEYNACPTPMDDENVAWQINEWVYGRTEGMIENFLTEEPDVNVQLLLVNALSMQARWSSPFDPMNTNAALFHAPEGDIEVSCMNQTASFAYLELDGVQTVALPYNTGTDPWCADLEMLVLLPDDGDLHSLVEDLSSSPDEFIARYTPSEEALVRLSLPIVRAESSFELKDILAANGVTDAFDQELADFSAMSPQAEDADLHIGSILQKTMLTVSETGTEAAAATVVEMMARSGRPAETVEMNVDRPFMMLVIAPESGYVLFAACVNNPA